MESIIRRIRTLLPTCLSMGLGAFFNITSSCASAAPAISVLVLKENPYLFRRLRLNRMLLLGHGPHRSALATCAAADDDEESDRKEDARRSIAEAGVRGWAKRFRQARIEHALQPQRQRGDDTPHRV